MKAFRLIPLLALMAFASCSANRQMAKDDTYYSPYGNTGSRMATGNGSYVSPSISSNSEYDYQAYYSDSKNYVSNADPVYQTTETVTDTNGVVYTTTETYYDADFAARIKRFGTQASSSMDYYDDYYTGGSDTYVWVRDWGGLRAKLTSIGNLYYKGNPSPRFCSEECTSEGRVIKLE